MNSFDWNDLRYFLAVARTGSTIAAAKDLGVNQSTVQRRLAALEEAIGRELVERLPVGYRLTSFGEELRPHAEAGRNGDRLLRPQDRLNRHRAKRHRAPDLLGRHGLPLHPAHARRVSYALSVGAGRSPDRGRVSGPGEGRGRHRAARRRKQGQRAHQPQARRHAVGALRQPLLCRASRPCRGRSRPQPPCHDRLRRIPGDLERREMAAIGGSRTLR